VPPRPIPVTLLYPVFGQFMDDGETPTPTKADAVLVLKLQEGERLRR